MDRVQTEWPFSLLHVHVGPVMHGRCLYGSETVEQMDHRFTSCMHCSVLRDLVILLQQAAATHILRMCH